MAAKYLITLRDSRQLLKCEELAPTGGFTQRVEHGIRVPQKSCRFIELYDMALVEKHDLFTAGSAICKIYAEIYKPCHSQ